MNRIILIRHCEAEGQDPGDPLTRQGERQSEILRDFLGDLPIDLVVASEYRRAGQTAKPLAGALGLDVQVDARFNERALSETPIANWREVLRDSFNDPDLHGPGGESAREASERAWAGLNDLLRSGCQLPAVVTHGNLLSLVLHSLDATFGYEGWERLSNPDLYLLQSTEPGRFNFRRIWNARNAEE
ncbi:MAG: histidine phosphatase family protein [Chloroflexi bacterium]|nr:histidine phosphatase family protein [Chloroflexota bacterium]